MPSGVDDTDTDWADEGAWRSVPEGDRMVVDLEGYEGPLDVLLELARAQKVDLAQISILELADQYLAFIGRLRRLRLEIAADYLVMAAWLAYLKSRLLLPEEPGEEDEATGPEMAAALAFQLRRLEAMREAGVKLLDRPRLGRDVFARGAPEGLTIVASPVYQVSLYDLLKAYVNQRRRTGHKTLRIIASDLYSVDEALKRLRTALGRAPDWQALHSFLPPDLKTELGRRSATASVFAASLELAKTGAVQIRQDRAFGPIYLRRGEGTGRPGVTVVKSDR